MTRKVAPGDLSPEELRRALAAFADAITDYHEDLAERRVLPDVSPADLAPLFAHELPAEGTSAEELIADWRARIEPRLTAVGSPRHFAYVNGSGSMIGMFADALAACTNTNAGGWKLGPAAADIERQALRWIAHFVGYPTDCGGICVTGGTMANFTALLTALRSVAPYDSTPGGLQDPRRTGRFLVYMSDHEGHVSIVRAVDMLNLGRDCIRRVPSRADFTMDPAALDRMIAEDRARGELPYYVVAQLGSVNVGAIDPIEAIADVCAKHRVWLHGDGACGLLAAGLAETRDRFRGIERVDSVSFDPHKWLGVPYDCGVVLVREAERLRRAFSITAPYLQPTGGSDERHGFDFLEWGPEMSRGFRALKLWMTLRLLGRRGLEAALSHGLALCRQLHASVAADPDFETLHEPILYLLSFRCVPQEWRTRAADPEMAARIDDLNQQIAEEVQRSGVALVMTTRIHGRVALRMSICSQRTTPDDIDRTFAEIRSAARRLAREPVRSGGSP